MAPELFNEDEKEWMKLHKQDRLFLNRHYSHFHRHRQITKVQHEKSEQRSPNSIVKLNCFLGSWFDFQLPVFWIWKPSVIRFNLWNTEGEQLRLVQWHQRQESFEQAEKHEERNWCPRTENRSLRFSTPKTTKIINL